MKPVPPAVSDPLLPSLPESSGEGPADLICPASSHGPGAAGTNGGRRTTAMADTRTALGCGSDGGKSQADDLSTQKRLISTKLVAAWYRLGLTVPGLEP